MVAPLIAAVGRIGTKVVTGSARAQLNEKAYAKNHTTRKLRDRKQAAARRFKTEAELAEMRRLNPHIAEEFLDSPIVSIPRRTIWGKKNQNDFNSSPIISAGYKNKSVKAKKASANFTCHGVALLVWAITALQIPITLIAIFIYIASFFPAFKLTPLALGVNALEWIYNVDIAGSVALGLLGLNAVISIGLIIGTMLMFGLLGVRFAWGEKQGYKIATLFFGVIGSIVQCLPCILWWVYIVRRNPN